MSDETALIQWDSIKSAIVACKDIIIMGKLNYSLEAIQQWAKQSKQSLETQNEIAEYRLRLNRKQGEWIEANIPADGWNTPTENSQGTLAEAGIDRNDSPKFRVLAKIPDAQFENYLAETKEASREITTNDACHLWKDALVTKFTGDQESYTPSLYIEAARCVMGSIDCDPASNNIAQQVVKAKAYYTLETDGLKQTWDGNIFLNPPYSHPEIAHFIDKLIAELKKGQQAILLTNDNTDTLWFQQAAIKSSVICFLRGRINFLKADGTKSSPTNGQTFFYFGDNDKRFVEYFKEFGLCMRRYDYQS